MHYINRVKGYTREHLTFLQKYMFGCLFGFGATAKTTAPDEDELMGFTFVTYDIQLNIMMHLPFAAGYGPPMMKFKQMVFDRVTFLYDRHLKELTVKVRYESPTMDDAKYKNQIQTESISNLPIIVCGYRFVTDGVPREVIH
jgi:hypothetical protein